MVFAFVELMAVYLVLKSDIDEENLSLVLISVDMLSAYLFKINFPSRLIPAKAPRVDAI